MQYLIARFHLQAVCLCVDFILRGDCHICEFVHSRCWVRCFATLSSQFFPSLMLSLFLLLLCLNLSFHFPIAASFGVIICFGFFLHLHLLFLSLFVFDHSFSPLLYLPLSSLHSFFSSVSRMSPPLCFPSLPTSSTTLSFPRLNFSSPSFLPSLPSLTQLSMGRDTAVGE